MKLKTIIILSSIIIGMGLAGTVKLQANKIKRQKAEIARVNHNYKVVQDSVKLIKGENGLYASRLEAQELTITELKTYYQNLVADVRDMKISLKKVIGITAFNTETTNNFHTFFRDSLVRDTVPIEYLDYHSEWLDLEIIKEGKDALIKNVSRDSLVNVIHWNYTGKFWPTKWLTEKEYYQDIKSFNPNSKITYSEWVRVIKKKRRTQKII